MSTKKILSTVLGALLFSTAGVSAELVDASKEHNTGMVKVDGSSTVYPITEAVAEEFGKAHKGVKVTVGISGTGGGFKKFIAGETDVSNASRPIKATESEAAAAKETEYIELPVAYDALTVVVNPKNTWATDMTVAELKKLWEPEAQGKITRWNQIRAEWPDQPIKLYGAGTDSGTFDYFTEAVNGKEKASRGDYTSSEDDNVVVQGVASDVNALGYFGLAYYEENKTKLKAVKVNGVLPSVETTMNGSYKPLSRPLFIYVRKDATDKKEVNSFVEFYLKNAPSLVAEVGYIPLQDEVYTLVTNRYAKGTAGSAFGAHGSQVGMTLQDLLKKESM